MKKGGKPLFRYSFASTQPLKLIGDKNYCTTICTLKETHCLISILLTKNAEHQT